MIVRSLYLATELEAFGSMHAPQDVVSGSIVGMQAFPFWKLTVRLLGIQFSALRTFLVLGPASVYWTEI